MSEYLQIGKLASLHGLRGEFVLNLLQTPKGAFVENRIVYMEEKQNAFLPWFIENISQKTPQAFYIKIEEINSREEARNFLLKNIFLEEKVYKNFFSAEKIPNLVGFKIYDDKKFIGTVESLVEYPNQLIAITIIKNKEVMLPLNEETIREINIKNREIFLKIPDGLLEIYL